MTKWNSKTTTREKCIRYRLHTWPSAQHSWHFIREKWLPSCDPRSSSGRNSTPSHPLPLHYSSQVIWSLLHSAAAFFFFPSPSASASTSGPHSICLHLRPAGVPYTLGRSIGVRDNFHLNSVCRWPCVFTRPETAVTNGIMSTTNAANVVKKILNSGAKLFEFHFMLLGPSGPA